VNFLQILYVTFQARGPSLGCKFGDAENAGLENAAPDCTGGKMKEWKIQNQYARPENVRLENVAPICRGENCRTGKCGKRHCMENHVLGLLMSPAKYKV